jgi:hypothetical protein
MTFHFDDNQLVSYKYIKNRFNHMDEIWKDILGYEGSYIVSNTGRVRSLARRVASNCSERGTRTVRERELKPTMSKGYAMVILMKNNRRERKKIHMLVAEYFIGPSNGLVIDHKDGNPLNNIASNLEYVSSRENTIRYTNRKRKEGKMLGAYSEIKNGRVYWHSRIHFNGRQHYIGGFKTQEEASAAYLKKLKEVVS